MFIYKGILFVIDPTTQLPTKEIKKTSINLAIVDYLKKKFNLDRTSVNGLIVGARGITINQFYDKFRHHFDLDSKLTDTNYRFSHKGLSAYVTDSVIISIFITTYSTRIYRVAMLRVTALGRR